MGEVVAAVPGFSDEVRVVVQEQGDFEFAGVHVLAGRRDACGDFGMLGQVEPILVVLEHELPVKNLHLVMLRR